MNWKKIGVCRSSDGQPNGYEYGFEVSTRLYGKCGSSDSY